MVTRGILQQLRPFLIHWGIVATLAFGPVAMGAGLEGAFGATLAGCFTDPSVYVSGRCADNVYRLGTRLAASGADLSRAHAVFVLYEERKVPPVPAYVKTPLIFPSRVRDPHAEWTFHVFLEVEPEDGEPMALDLDYKSVPVPLDQYFARVFPGNPAEYGTDRLARLFVRVIPWYEYAAAYQSHGGDEVAQYYRSYEVPLHPVISARQYLTSLGLGL